MADLFGLQNQKKRLSKLSFWQSRSRWLKAKFEFQRRFYRAREIFFDRQGDANILQVLVRSTIFSFLFSLIFLVFLILLPFPEIQIKYIDSYDNFLIAVASIA
jgi:hypothetical protein